MGFIWPTQRFRGSSKEDLTPPLGSLHGFKHGFSETRFARVLVVSNPHRFGVYCKRIVWFKRGSGLLSPGDGNFTTNIKQGGLRRRAQFTHGDTVFLGVMFQMTVLKGFKVGVGIVKRALSYPVKLIAKNPGVNGSVLSDKVFSFNDQNWIY